MENITGRLFDLPVMFCVQKFESTNPNFFNSDNKIYRFKRLMGKGGEVAVNNEEFAKRIEAIRTKLYKTALTYLGNEALAMDAVDEAVYKALCGKWKLRQIEFFDTWITRILINECHNELRRQKRFQPLDELPETAAKEFDALPLKEALRKLPKDMKDVIILRFFGGYTVAETAQTLHIPAGTVSTRQRKALQLLRLELEEEVSS